ncbi:polyhomeotic-like protein 3 [Brachionichthys hirsutus]|uniref:polyhomeotic-like protein 3 n=1 Tax=Brachionichthys hirsutus TaxID=412623 RepID=UPI003605118E
MDTQSPGEKQPDTKRSVASTTPTPSSAVSLATVSTSSTTCTQAPSASVSIVSPDRQAVQVIQHTIHRPQNMAAQYLHQMYAAQQHHLMLQTAALQQHQHAPHLQSLAAIQQPSGVSQNSTALPASPATAQLVGRTQTSSSTGAAATMSQQAMVLGNRPANCNQAQMYLRTQMLILTPAATMAAVQTDLPAVSSCSSSPASSQVQNLALSAHLPGGMASAHSVILKPSSQSQSLPPAVSLSKTSACLLKSSQSPVQTHSLVKQQLHRPPGHRVAHHHHLILQQGTGGAANHRKLQPIALRVAPQEANSTPLSLSVKRLNTPSSQSQTKSDPRVPSSSSSSSSSSSLSVTSVSGQTLIPAATIQPQPQPPPLLAAPQHRTSFSQVQNQPAPPPLALPRLPQNPPASLKRLSMHSVHALDVQSGRVSLEALVKMPYQNLPPPQTVAVDLKVHRVRRDETPMPRQTCKVNGLSLEERKDESPQRDVMPASMVVPPTLNGAVMGSSSIISSRSVIRSPLVEEPSQLATSSSNGSDPPTLPPPLPPTVMPATLRVPSQPASSLARLPGSPDRILAAHILTHLIEGFVIREGLEPFPVVPSLPLTDKQAALPECQETQTNVDAAEDSPLDADQSDSSDSEMENDNPAVDELGETAADVLQCEFCGSRGYAHTFLRSRRFCSMACVRRFSVSCTKRISVLRARRWGHRPVGRRGRPPSRINGASRQHFVRQAHTAFGSEEPPDEEKEDGCPVPMTTRLRKQAEREREREREWEQRLTETASDKEEDIRSPSQWNVDEVFSYINSLPGGPAVAEEFRSHEIDGQSLLLLTEEHMVSTMNLKLGPALKLCAHINSLQHLFQSRRLLQVQHSGTSDQHHAWWFIGPPLFVV